MKSSLMNIKMDEIMILNSEYSKFNAKRGILIKLLSEKARFSKNIKFV